MFLLAPAALLLLPRSSQACDPDPCYTSDKWQSFALVSEQVATDGVLLIDGRRGPQAWQLSDAEALAYLTAEVTADGEPISGRWRRRLGRWRRRLGRRRRRTEGGEPGVDGSEAGCSCSAEPRPRAPWLAGGLLVLLAGVRRRNRAR